MQLYEIKLIENEVFLGDKLYGIVEDGNGTAQAQVCMHTIRAVCVGGGGGCE